MSSHFQVESWLNFYQVESLHCPQVDFESISSHFRVKSAELTETTPRSGLYSIMYRYSELFSYVSRGTFNLFDYSAKYFFIRS